MSRDGSGRGGAGRRPDQTVAFEIDGRSVAPGARSKLALNIGALYSEAPVTLPVHVLNGRRAGPVLFVSAALHGDEVNGVEIIRRLLRLPALDALAGTLVTVPVVNVLGFLQQSRYLPDRRDLNRSFPGSERGSLAARIAHRFLTQVVNRADYGIDLHSGAAEQPNLPHIRADLRNTEALRLARAFGAPLLLDSAPMVGTLREYTTARGTPVLLYETGEALRFDEVGIRIGLRGIVNVMRAIGMLPAAGGARKPVQPVVARDAVWIRSPVSGVLRPEADLGDVVGAGDRLGVVGDPVGGADTRVPAAGGGVILGRSFRSLVRDGDALFHIARVDDPVGAAAAVAQARRLASAVSGQARG